MIYFITTEQYEYVKVGYTNNLNSRISQMKVGNPYDLIVIKTINGGYLSERSIHKELKEHSHKGEWFFYNAFVRQYIDCITNKADNSIRCYPPDTDDKVEGLYKRRLSNIEIQKQLDISIHKVRWVIKKRKLKNKYSHLPKPKYYHNGNHKKNT